MKRHLDEAGTEAESLAIELPPAFLERMRRLARSYLEHQDPRLQSGFGDGAARWRAEREPILAAIETHGSLLDLGCANGFLLECLREWGTERGLELVPFGLDLSPELVALARERLPAFASHFHVGDAWSWSPATRFTYVYTLADLVPFDRLCAHLCRVLDELVEPGGRLIVGSYGSDSRRIPPLDLERLLLTHGIRVSGTASAGPAGVAVVRFAWCDGRRPGA